MKVSMLAIAISFLMAPFFAFAANVEVVLKDNLDGDLNGYCLDIMGGGQNVDPSRGLQAHTCYSYRGDLGSDQAITPESIEKGQFYLPGYEVCALMGGLEEGANVALSSCDDNELQQFVFSENGSISPKGASGMCLTAGEDTAFGRNGTSPHQIKTLTLQTCSDELAAYQRWYTRTQEDYNAEQNK